MDKIFNTISIVLGLLGGGLAYIYQGFDSLLCGICILVVLDYVTGLIKAVYNKQLSSAIGYKGLLKKVLIFLVIALACVIQRTFGDVVPLREVVIVFYIANESISIIENASEIMPIPEKLKEILQQLRDKGKFDE